MNGTLVKNQLIFDFASGSLGPAKSIFASTYLYLNSKAKTLNHTFEGLLGEQLFNNENAEIKKLKYSDCISDKHIKETKINSEASPITNLVGPLNELKWKQVYRGFNEFSPNIKDDDEIKLIKMDPGVSVPIHSHGGREYILVLSGSFCDEYGKYNKGDIQINDQKIKHTPIACENEGCICLSITEKDAIFYGRYGSFLNLFTFIRSFFK
tara:strand:+ start:105 stop:734 length:630 start_codon:yes stop_codon:yes gene_type:complete